MPSRKNELRPHLVKGWVILEASAVRGGWRSGPLRGALRRKRPVVCFDERPANCSPICVSRLASERAVPSGATTSTRARHGPPLRVLRTSYGLARGGVERRRGGEFAEFVRYLAEDLYSKAEKIRLVVDNLNIHSAASFYELFDAERARELTRRIEFCYTPVDGSWLNMAER